MAKTHEKNLARQLYLDTQLQMKQIAFQVGVSEKTLGKWCEEENWDELKAAKHTTREEIIAKKYKLLLRIINLNEEKLDEGTLSPADIDAEHKLSMSIKALSQQETLSGYIQAFTPWLKWLHEEKPELAKQVAEYQQKFLLNKAQELS